MSKNRIICQCEIYETCEVCREETERDLEKLRQMDEAIRQSIQPTSKKEGSDKSNVVQKTDPPKAVDENYTIDFGGVYKIK